jgi:hypothetical protein
MGYCRRRSSRDTREIIRLELRRKRIAHYFFLPEALFGRFVMEGDSPSCNVTERKG